MVSSVDPMLLYIQSKKKPYLCDDVIKSIQYLLNTKTYCNRCGTHIDEHKINACFLRTHVLCFYCYHKCVWPK